MHQSVARTLRFLGRIINQQAAVTNAAEGSATLRQRRQDREHVDDYLQGRTPDLPTR